MAGTVSGGVQLSTSLTVAVAATGNVLTAYSVPTQVSLPLTYSAGNGANQANKVAQLGGTLNATTLDTDLTSIVCTDDTVGFSHVRELLIINDATNASYTLATGNDGVVTNAFSPSMTATGNGATGATFAIEPGSPYRAAKPLGTAGWVVDTTHKKLRIDAGANAVAYRIIIVGD